MNPKKYGVKNENLTSNLGPHDEHQNIGDNLIQKEKIETCYEIRMSVSSSIPSSYIYIQEITYTRVNDIGINVYQRGTIVKA